MKKNVLILITAAICLGTTFSQSAFAQFSFTNANNRLSATSHSGCSVTVVDVNNDGLDDILKMENSIDLVLELQNRDGSFSRTDLGPIPDNSAVWGMAAADVDHNGWKDVAAGSGSCYLFKLFENAGVVTATTTALPQNYFVQNITFGDFNNDGWADLFVCDDNDYAKVYVNNAGTLSVTTSLINTNINPGMFYGGDPYDSGNYGSVWTDFDNDGDLDLYIAHCRQSAGSSSDQRRRDRLFVNDGNNNYSEQAQAYGIEVTDFKQTWTTSFGDINNDGDLDIVMTNHGENGQILENDGTGHYTDITATTGFTTPNTDPIESFFEDFDNDGFVDILISGGGPGNSYFMYHNNGNNTFTLASNPIPATTNGMLSFAAGDLNHDGKIDIFASYGNVYNSPTNTDDVLYLNTTSNNNNFISFALKGTVSNEGAIGSRVSIYGPWGVQIREVRAGESYGTCNSSQLHFGIGQATTIDSAVVWFTSGTTTTLTGLTANQFVSVVEGGCVITGNTIPGPYILCTGQSLTLTAPAGYSAYSWNDGSTTQSITVSAAGTYNVLVTDATGCSGISPSVNVVLNPDETPTVTTVGELIFCEGGSATLTSTPAAGYLWSDGSTTQSIAVTQTGSYAVTIQGVCGSFTSANTDVTVLAAPVPVGTGASGPSPSILVLSATGTNLSWYDQQTGGTLLGTGTTFTTPLINTTTTYWVDDRTDYPGAINYTGQTYHEGSLYSGGANTNGALYFDVLSACTLNSVKVYTDSPGNREIQLKNGAGTVIQSLLVNIPLDSSRVNLNFTLAPGIGYSITTNPTVNNQTLGTTTPRLQRSSQGVTYPYTVNNLVSISGSNQGSAYYYYFYDWEVSEPSYECTSARVPVVADITTGLNAVNSENTILVYPNPADHFVTVEMNKSGNVTADLFDVTGRIVKSLVFDSNKGSKINFDLTGIARGSYNLRIQNSEGVVVKKLSVN